MTSKTLTNMAASRPWIAHIDDERGDGNSIIISLANGWFFADETDCGVRGFDTVREAEQGTRRPDVINRLGA